MSGRSISGALRPAAVDRMMWSVKRSRPNGHADQRARADKPSAPFNAFFRMVFGVLLR
ncbi:MAG: hypothetical protein JF597_31160 [Streptomyces sp.]|uniref:hypothetical protein n=1 Tax=Streptomyces sp. TaxID=1931 RepID=UPI0025F55F81|nr:hypothetical protein [Streptomyces sp.]MBW8797883.1 hypothetical protein [Streptomyces sp.]